MDIYDPIAEALGLIPIKIYLPTIQESIELGYVLPWASNHDIVPWNKGLTYPSPIKGRKIGKQKSPKRALTEEHKQKLKGPNFKLKEYASNRSSKHLENIRKAATKQTKCRYCSKVAAQVSIARWHNENCKHKPA